MKYVLLPEAEDDIDRLYNFLVEKNPLAAQKAMLAIDEGLSLLQDNPQFGTAMENHKPYRQLFVPFGKSVYVLRYRIHEEADTLVVVRIWHGKESRE